MNDSNSNNPVGKSTTTKTRKKRTMKKSPIHRLFEKISKPSAANACWTFTGATSPNGYCGIFVDGKMTAAHRFAYRSFIGPIPPGKVIGHICDQKNCCNPLHLIAFTQRDNMQDKMNKQRANPLKKHRGKSLTPAERTSIYRMLDSGMTGFAVAKSTGRSEQHISYLKRHRKAIEAKASKIRRKTAICILEPLNRTLKSCATDLQQIAA